MDDRYSFIEEAKTSWALYELTGERLDFEALDTWLQAWGTDSETPLLFPMKD